MESTLFEVFSLRTRGSARGVIRVPHPVHAVLSLIVSFVSACGLMMLLQVEFMSLIFVVVYVGAIAVLFLFVVMLRNLNSAQAGLFDLKRLDVWSTLRLLRVRMGSVVAMVDGSQHGIGHGLNQAVMSESSLNAGAYVQWVERLDSMTTLQTIGQVLYTHGFVYLLLAGFVLLVARIGAIVLTLKVRSVGLAKRQHIHQQRSRNAELAIMKTRVVHDRS